MKQSELERFIKSNDVGRVTLYRATQAEPWEVWAYDIEGSKTLSPWGNRLQGIRSGEPKTYTSLDRAYLAIRKMGFSGAIEIDG